MVFSDPAFLFYFLPIGLLAYWSGMWRFRNSFLLLISVFFYTSGGGGLIALVLLSSLWTYFVALAIDRRSTSAAKARMSGIGVGLLIALLMFWKYLNFVSEQLANLVSALVTPVDLSTSIVLPIAISFYTFQCVSYIIDVKRREIAAERNVVTFLCYVMFFPQLIAGPIVRFVDVQEQLSYRPAHLWNDFCVGAPRFFLGLSKKVLIADQAGQLADAAFGVVGYQLTAADTVIGVVAYTIQIYFDFSGYSDMAIGLSKMFGISFPENFRHPYMAASVTDFWRRWHISLSTWFRDYVYIPLGGNRGSKAKTYRNLAVVFLLTGFWHGAQWTFLAWGILHGTALVIERLIGVSGTPASKMGFFLGRLWTLVVVVVGWLMFRSVNLSHFGELIASLVRADGWSPSAMVSAALTNQRIFWTAIGLFAFVTPGRLSTGERLSNGQATLALRFGVTGMGALASLYVMSASFSPFLYFQF